MTRSQAIRREVRSPEPAQVDVDLMPLDARFSALLGTVGWRRLPAPIRARFSKRLEAGASVTYAGRIVDSHRSWLGAVLAQLCRLIGAPLPLHDDIAVPAVVTVTEDAATGGQF